MPELVATLNHFSKVCVSRPLRRPRKRIANCCIVAKSLEVFLGRSTLATCASASNPRGLMHTAAATMGGTSDALHPADTAATEGTGSPVATAKCARRQLFSSRCGWAVKPLGVVDLAAIAARGGNASSRVHFRAEREIRPACAHR